VNWSATVRGAQTGAGQCSIRGCYLRGVCGGYLDHRTVEDHHGVSGDELASVDEVKGHGSVWAGPRLGCG